MKKILAILFAAILSTTLFIGCSKDEAPETNDNNQGTETPAEDTDAVTTASIVADAEGVLNRLSAEGTWIVATLNDIVVDSEIIVDGQFHDKDDAAQDIYRKLGLYTQDADRNILEQFTLTAPRMTVKSENFRIQGGTFIGDVYVEAKGFNLGKASGVEGNIYFASQELMDTFTMDETAKVSGVIQVPEVDAMTTASLVADAAGVVNGLSAEGTWIVATLKDIVVNEDIVVEGEFHDKGDASQKIYRKLGLYTQDAERNILEQFTLTAPKLIVRSENFRIQGGTFVGDVYVEAKGFNLGKASGVEGNIYFATQEYMDSFTKDDTAVITGQVSLQ